MRRLLLFAVGFPALLPFLLHAQAPEAASLKLPTRATAMPFPDRATALSKKRMESPWCVTLNGAWKFAYSERATEAPAGFEKDGFDLSTWKDIPVPSNWQLHGYGILKSGKAGEAKDDSSGCYRRTFTLPAGWEARRTRIAFAGVESAFQLWINGQKAGDTEDATSTTEFDVTSLVKPGENTVSVKVSPVSKAEARNTWQLRGIYRDVYLWSSPLVEMADHHLATGLADDFARGTISFHSSLKNHDPAPRAGKLKLEILAPDGAAAFAKESTFSIPGSGEISLDLSADTPPSVRSWSSETPNLYSYVITLTDPAGQATAVFAGKTGFCRDEVKNGRLLHNGQPILIKGVVYRQHSSRFGHSLTEAELQADLYQIKRANINALRVKSPGDPRLLNLCDELGLYVFTEPDAGLSNATRDRNHPSLIFGGALLRDPAGKVDDRGPQWLEKENPSLADCVALVREEEKKPLEKQRPILLGVYSRATGNACGNLAAYWELFEKEPLLQGGFISEWKDQSLTQRNKTEDGKPAPGGFITYDGNLALISGVAGFSPAATATPKFEEVKKVLQDIRTTLVDGGSQTLKLKISNDRFFRPLDQVKASWKLLKDGKDVAQGEIALPVIGSHQSAEITIPVSVQPDVAAEFILRVRYDLKESAIWSSEGMPIAWDELPLPWGKRVSVIQPTATAPATFTEETETVQITAGEVVAVVRKSDGAMSSLKRKNEEILLSPLRLDFWRIPTQNDKSAGLDQSLAVWREAGSKAKATSFKVAQDGNHVRINVTLAIPAGKSTAEVVYAIDGNGAIVTDVEFKPDPAQSRIPRIGMTCGVAMAMTNWTWFGKGPHENYTDRNYGAWTTIHNGLVGALVPRYTNPQEAGNRTDVRWATFDNPSGGNTLRIETLSPTLLEISAMTGIPSDYEVAKVSSDLSKPEMLTLHFDHLQMGVGSGVRGLATDRTYQWSFGLTTSWRKPMAPKPPSPMPPGIRPPPGVQMPQLPPGVRQPGVPLPPVPAPKLPPPAPTSPSGN